jgi:hypothetical protein
LSVGRFHFVRATHHKLLTKTAHAAAARRFSYRFALGAVGLGRLQFTQAWAEPVDYKSSGAVLQLVEFVCEIF